MLLRVMKHCQRLQECHLIHFLLPACLGLNHRMPTMSIEEAGLREMKMMKWQERAAKMMKEANSPTASTPPPQHLGFTATANGEIPCLVSFFLGLVEVDSCVCVCHVCCHRDFDILGI